MTDTYVDELARICDEAARVFLDGLPAVPSDATPTPFWELDRGDIEASIGSDEPHRWIHEIVSSCLSEAANELLAIGALLRCATVTASLDPLVRAVVERAGLARVRCVKDRIRSSLRPYICKHFGFTIFVDWKSAPSSSSRT